MNVLVLNCGSASTKFAVVHASNGHVHVSGTIQPLGGSQATLEFTHEDCSERRTVPGAGIDASLRTTFELLREIGLRIGCWASATAWCTAARSSRGRSSSPRR